VCVSHSHLDHAAHLKEYVKIFKCYSSLDTFDNLKITHHNVSPMLPIKAYPVGNFQVVGFDVTHDVRCFGFCIQHKEIGVTVFITDASEVNYKFDKLTNILLEINYDEEILDDNFYKGHGNGFLRERIKNAHLSLEQAKEFLLNNDLSNVLNILLLHLSNSNSHALNFKSEIEKLTGKIVTIAEQGTVIELNGF
jgi:hypothetical protein